MSMQSMCFNRHCDVLWAVLLYCCLCCFGSLADVRHSTWCGILLEDLKDQVIQEYGMHVGCPCTGITTRVSVLCTPDAGFAALRMAHKPRPR